MEKELVMDLQALLHSVLVNPISMGLVQKFVVDFIKSQLKSVDASGVVTKYKGAVQPIVFVLTALTTALDQALNGAASGFDPTALVSYFMTLYATSIAAHVVVKGGKKEVEKVVDKVKASGS